MSADNPPDAVDELRERIAELEETVDDQRETIQRMLPSRREAVIGAGAALFGGGSILTGQAAAGSNQAGTAGTNSNRLDFEAEDIDLTDQSSTPTDPESGQVRIYAENGKPFYRPAGGSAQPFSKAFTDGDGDGAFTLPKTSQGIDVKFTDVRGDITDIANSTTIYDESATQIGDGTTSANHASVDTDALSGADLSTAASGEVPKSDGNGNLQFGSVSGFSLPQLPRSDGVFVQIDWTTLDGFFTTSSGSASASLFRNQLNIKTGTTDESHIRVRKTTNAYGNRDPTFDKDRTLRVQAVFMEDGGTAAAVMGRIREGSFGDQHVGVRTDSTGALLGTVGNGSSETTTSLTSSADDNDIRVEYTAGSQAEFFVNGTSQGTISSGLPTGSTRAKQLNWYGENNTATGLAFRFGQTQFVQHP